MINFWVRVSVLGLGLVSWAWVRKGDSWLGLGVRGRVRKEVQEMIKKKYR